MRHPQLSEKSQRLNGVDLYGRLDNQYGKRAQQRKNLRDNTRYDRKVAKLTQPRPNGFGN